jgi:hypothetical protein
MHREIRKQTGRRQKISHVRHSYRFDSLVCLFGNPRAEFSARVPSEVSFRVECLQSSFGRSVVADLARPIGFDRTSQPRAWIRVSSFATGSLSRRRFQVCHLLWRPRGRVARLGRRVGCASWDSVRGTARAFPSQSARSRPSGGPSDIHSIRAADPRPDAAPSVRVRPAGFLAPAALGPSILWGARAVSPRGSRAVSPGNTGLKG